MMNKKTLKVDLSDIVDKYEDALSGEEHTYGSCNDDDRNWRENAYYNGCVRCVNIAIAIAEAAQKEYDLEFVYEEE